MKETTTIFNQQFDSENPVFIDAKLHVDIVEDDWRLLGINTGISLPRPFMRFEVGQLNSSAQRDYEAGRYRFIGFQSFMFGDRVNVERQHYGLGELLAEVGGLFSAL